MAVSGNPDTFTAAIRQYAQTLLTDMHMHRARRARVLLRAPVARGGRPPRSRVFGAGVLEIRCKIYSTQHRSILNWQL